MIVILLELSVKDLGTKTDRHHDRNWKDDHLIPFPRSTIEESVGDWWTIFDEKPSVGGLHDSECMVKTNTQGLDG
jgi:hypothetical protein